MNRLFSFPPKSILVPTDMGMASISALKYARFFHERFESKISVLHAEHLDLPVYFSSSQLGDLKREMIKLTRAATEYVRKESASILGFFPGIKIVENNPLDAILDQSQNNLSDLIIMGAERKKSNLGEIFSSTTTGVMQLAVGPLLLIPKNMQ
jgi:nucleotide-binding universal stress UspA family protein